MQKIFKIFIVILAFPFLISARQISIRNITLYLPHAETKRLISKNDRIVYTADDDLAGVIYSRLAKYSEGPEYLDLFHENSYAFSNQDTATADISVMPLSDSAAAEYLTIYSIVNSLTSTGEIITVTFTQNGIPEKDLYGFCDMRETFIPDFSFCS